MTTILLLFMDMIARTSRIVGRGGCGGALKPFLWGIFTIPGIARTFSKVTRTT